MSLKKQYDYFTPAYPSCADNNIRVQRRGQEISYKEKVPVGTFARLSKLR